MCWPLWSILPFRLNPCLSSVWRRLWQERDSFPVGLRWTGELDTSASSHFCTNSTCRLIVSSPFHGESRTVTALPVACFWSHTWLLPVLFQCSHTRLPFCMDQLCVNSCLCADDLVCKPRQLVILVNYSHTGSVLLHGGTVSVIPLHITYSASVSPPAEASV